MADKTESAEEPEELETMCTGTGSSVSVVVAFSLAGFLLPSLLGALLYVVPALG